MKTLFNRIALSAALLALAGCMTVAEVRAERIRKHYEHYSALSQETQQRVADGTVAIGDPRDAVWLAFGPPSKTSSKVTAEGSTEIWQYTRHVTETSQVLVDAPLPPPPPYGRRDPYWHGGYDGPHFETVYRTVETLAMQITLQNGLVAEIQTFN